jgi:hypothetical protein
MQPIWLRVLAISIGLSFVSVSQAWITTASNNRKSSSSSSSMRLTNDPYEKVADDPQKDESILVVAEQLRRKAEQLRNEVNQFEKAKQVGQMEQLAQEEQVRTEREQRRHRYSCVVPILKPDGSTVLERCDFPPRYYDTNNNNNSSSITTVEASLPLGILLGENDDGSISIDDVAELGNGATAGLRVTDLLRAITACRVDMALPTWQLLAGGIGRPKTVRFMYGVDNRPLNEVMAAVASNRLDPENRPVLLVIERRMVE